jgi:hypothetical protein
MYFHLHRSAQSGAGAGAGRPSSTGLCATCKRATALRAQFSGSVSIRKTKVESTDRNVLSIVSEYDCLCSDFHDTRFAFHLL